MGFAHGKVVTPFLWLPMTKENDTVDVVKVSNLNLLQIFTFWL